LIDRFSSEASSPAATTLPVSEVHTSLLRLYAILFKLRIGFSIALSAIGGAILAAGQWPMPADVLILSFGVLLASSGAAGYNHYFERGIDAVMGRTQTRPFVSGQLSAHMGWLLVFSLLMISGSGLVAWHFNLTSGLFVLAGALTYAVVYTLWLKRRTHWNIVIGGAAGSWAVLAGAAASGDFMTMPVLLLSLVLFLWTPSHFWSLSIAIVDDYRRAGVPMLPVTHGCETAARWNMINTLILTGSTIWLVVLLPMPVFAIGALSGAGYLLWTTYRMLVDTNRDTAMTAFKGSLIQLSLLLLGLFTAYAIN